MTKCQSVLIVEDDAAIRDTLKHIIESEGFVVFIAENGQEAIKKLKMLSRRPCLVLVDFMMPIMNGEELIKEMSESDILSSIPVVMVSAQEKPATVKRFIKKPYSLECILEVLNEYCR
jgi:CheY-like chemotaxis protein